MRIFHFMTEIQKQQTKTQTLILNSTCRHLHMLVTREEEDEEEEEGQQQGVFAHAERYMMKTMTTRMGIMRA